MLKAGVANSKPDDVEPAVGVPRWKSRLAKQRSEKLDTTLSVKTPENISFDYQIAGPFRRIFAYFFDIVISLGAYLVLSTMIYLAFAIILIPLAGYFGAQEIVTTILEILAAFINVGWFVLLWFYGAYMEACYNGQTLGKRITKMRVITTDGHAIDGVQATLRNFFRLLDVMPMVPIASILVLEPSDTPMDMLMTAPILPTCLFGLIVMTLSRKYQRVGDLVANTVVVNEVLKRQPNLATFLDERVPQLAELIPTSFVVSATMARSIADYVDQRKYLPFQRASEIAGHLAHPLIERFGIPKDTDHDLFLCALYYKKFISEQGEKEEGGLLLPGQKLPQENDDGDPGPPNSGPTMDVQKEFQLDPSDFRIET